MMQDDSVDQPEADEDEFARGPGRIITAAVQILSDGKSRKTEELLRDAVRAKLIAPETTQNQVAVDLRSYIFRYVATGRSPVIVEDKVTHEFRLNGPVDDWPSVTLAPRPRYMDEKAIQATEHRLRRTAVGTDPAAFEEAVCDAFAMLGFVATHVGGLAEPDGKLEAPLGPLSYSVILECKSTPTAEIVRNAQPEEPARFRDAVGAEYALLVGPVFKEDVHLREELVSHKVSLWAIDDILTALRNDVNPLECRELFAPGIVRERLATLEWERSHGAEKRAKVVQDILRREGYASQRALTGHIAPADAPLLTLDAAMILVEAELRRLNVSKFATRAEVETAMSDLIRAGEAVTVPGREGIVIVRG